MLLNLNQGDIYLGIDIFSRKEVAIKLERADAGCPQLVSEARIYQNLIGGIGIPTLHWSGPEGDYNTLVIERLGSSLDELLNCCGGKFSLTTVLLLADQMVRASASPDFECDIDQNCPDFSH
jgi:hypothetical protein